ncbi:MAG: hypothetical protein KGL18_10510 [Burkholderiales bacterium]|nr:hypothetical protein [Burkholderiales bacterium]MDE1925615.1 hypothetical protein [Burkholderiales bacterium]MDE2159580.1 hypothetical protein [Burkholderiales bacterium]MDE2503391.1 hypothetical protein [Burkholderiales bacterium]
MAFIGSPRRPEIDQYTIRFLVGAIALLLPWVEIALTRGAIASISESYWWTGAPWPRNLLVGCLFAIAAFMAAYNGRDEIEMWLGKLGAAAALGIALFPCSCGDPARQLVPRVHALAVAAMFGVLGAFCLIFRARARAKGHREAQRRAAIYGVCGIGMLFALGLFGIEAALGIARLAFWAETLGLMSFGISWLTASRVLPGITGADERQRLLVRD